MVKRGAGPLTPDFPASVSSAQALTLAGGGRWYGSYGVLACPVCQPEARPDQNALTLCDGPKGLLAHCKKVGCSYSDLAAALAISPGSYSALDPAIIARRETVRMDEVTKRARRARSLWSEAIPIHGSIAETYLRKRGITCALPGTLRFHPECWHPTANRFPALIARVDGSKDFAVHRTYLLHDGKGKADAEPQKAMLGSVKGGAVQLINATGPLVVAEGIETALSLASGMLQGPATIWAALSTSGIRGLRLPQARGCLIIATDGDVAGKAAGQLLAERAVNLGWEASLRSAPDGCDWNDALRLKGSSRDQA